MESKKDFVNYVIGNYSKNRLEITGQEVSEGDLGALETIMYEGFKKYKDSKEKRVDVDEIHRAASKVGYPGNAATGLLNNLAKDNKVTVNELTNKQALNSYNKNKIMGVGNKQERILKEYLERKNLI